MSNSNAVLLKIKTVWDSSNTFDIISKTVNSAKDRVNELNKGVVTHNKNIGQLKESIVKWRGEQEKSFRTDHIRKYNQLIDGAKRKIKEIEDAAKTCGEKTQSIFGSVFKADFLMRGLVTAKNALVGFSKDSMDAYKRQNVAQTQLEQVMKNTMGAGKWDVEDIVDFTKAQQKLGVVSRDVQMSGAKELSTYIHKKDSLKSLIPTMNNMLAYQFGLNATQEQAANIATMMGKVLDGQTGALSKNGYAFTEAEEKVLKYGNESERVAVLTEVVERSVKGVNAALLETPEGKAKQLEMEYNELKIRVGELATKMKTEGLVILYKYRNAVVGIAKVTASATAAVGAYLVVTKGWNILSRANEARVAALTVLKRLFKRQVDAATGSLIAFNAVKTASGIGAILAVVAAAATAFALFRKRTKEASDSLKKAGEYSREYYNDEKKFLDEHFEKMKKSNAKSKERNNLVDELKTRYPGLNEQLEKELRTTNDLNAAKETLISLIKKEAITEGMKQLLKEKSKAVSDAELAAYIEEEENKTIRAYNDRVTNDINRLKNADGTIPANDAAIGAIASMGRQYKSEKTEGKIALEKANKEFITVGKLLEGKERELLASLAGAGGSGGGGGNGDGDDDGNKNKNKYTSTASDAITGGGRQVKNFYINIGNLIGENTNRFESSKDDPRSAQDFMGKLSEALQMVVNDANYAAA